LLADCGSSHWLCASKIEDLRKQVESLQSALEDKRTLITTLRSQLTSTRADLMRESSLREQAETALLGQTTSDLSSLFFPAHISLL
jgi:hypothetical protein